MYTHKFTTKRMVEGRFGANHLRSVRCHHKQRRLLWIPSGQLWNKNWRQSGRRRPRKSQMWRQTQHWTGAHTSHYMLTIVIRSLCFGPTTLEFPSHTLRVGGLRQTLIYSITEEIYARFNYARFYHVRFNHARFNHARFNHVRFNHARFNHARFNHARFNHVRFNHVRFNHARFNQVRSARIILVWYQMNVNEH